jgi:DNA-binding LacI/PurR family transcriptional regulator
MTQSLDSPFALPGNAARYHGPPGRGTVPVMKRLSASRTRPPVKQQQIAADLRQQIVQGELKPGTQLPTRVELEQQFDVSTITVQRALDQLAGDGFVVARGRQGTFVAEHPPHLSTYALIFPHRHSEGRPWPRFWTALVQETMRVQQEAPQRRFAVFHDVEGHSSDEDYHTLVASIRSQRLAGLMFFFNPLSLANTPVLTEPGIPRVGLLTRTVPGIRRVHIDSPAFARRAAEYLRQRQRRRAAILTIPGRTSDRLPGGSLLSVLTAAGIECPPHLQQAVDPHHPQWADNAARLLLSGGDRPDALIITDDNLVEHASAGLVAAGVSVPGELDVIAHCNFPWPTPSVLPVRRLGYDAREVLRACIADIDAQRRGETLPATEQMILPRFEDELPPE